MAKPFFSKQILLLCIPGPYPESHTVILFKTFQLLLVDYIFLVVKIIKNFFEMRTDLGGYTFKFGPTCQGFDSYRVFWGGGMDLWGFLNGGWVVTWNRWPAQTHAYWSKRNNISLSSVLSFYIHMDIAVYCRVLPWYTIIYEK